MFLDSSSLKAFADEKIELTEKKKNEVCFGNGRKYCGKRRKCLLPAFSPFQAKFSKGFIFKVVKSWDCVVKGESTSPNVKTLKITRQ